MRGVGEPGRLDAVVPDAGIDVGELVPSAGAKRAADLQEPPAMVSPHDVGHRVEQRGMTRQTRPERRQRIGFRHPADHRADNHDDAELRVHDLPVRRGAS